MTKKEALELFDQKMRATTEYGWPQTMYIKNAIEQMAEVMAEAIERLTEKNDQSQSN